jgi:hypothetical protein
VGQFHDILQLGFERKRELNKWKAEGKRPALIPSSPNITYRKKGWLSWPDWVGFSFMSFEEARTYMRRLGLKNRPEYWQWRGSGKRPKTIPYSPEKEYKNAGWKDLGDYLGTGNEKPSKKERMNYAQAKLYIQAIGLKTEVDFYTWRTTTMRPDTFPPDPYRYYGDEFEGWGKFLGTNRVANQDRTYWEYDQAKAFLKPLHIQSRKSFKQLFDMGVIPSQIPKRADAYYMKHGTWVSFSDFLSIEARTRQPQ